MSNKSFFVQLFLFINKELKPARPSGGSSPRSRCQLATVCVCACVTDQSDGVLRPQHSEHGLKMFLEVTWGDKRFNILVQFQVLEDNNCILGIVSVDTTPKITRH